jgi:RNA polymerase sigma factor for flagellar operon FliA
VPTQTALSDHARDLVVTHLPMVRQVLAGVAAHYPRHADREELAQAATLGLVEAAARYDASRGVPFDRWAALRIRGAIVDAVRAMDFAPRMLRSAARNAEAARADLEGELGRSVSDEEVAAKLGMSTEELSALQGRVHRALVLSLDARTGDNEGEGATLGASIVDEVTLAPDEVLEQRETARYVMDALACLPERLRTVVSGYFLEGRTSAEIAEELGVTESRVSQLRSEALLLMRVGIESQYAGETATAASNPAAASRQAAFAAQLSARSSYSARLSQLPRPRTAVETAVPASQ